MQKSGKDTLFFIYGMVLTTARLLLRPVARLYSFKFSIWLVCWFYVCANEDTQREVHMSHSSLSQRMGIITERENGIAGMGNLKFLRS